MSTRFRVAEHSGENRHLALLRWSLVAIFVWFGIQKFTPYAADAIAPLIYNSPFVTWLAVVGVVGEARIIGSIELVTAALLIVGSVLPIASTIGSTMAALTFMLTTSFIFSTPGITLTSPTGFPIVSTLLEQFLIKDVALLAASLTLLVASIRRHSIGIMAGHPFDNDNLDESFSVKNSVKYSSANYAGLEFGGLYDFSNAAGQFSNNRAWSVGALYGSGPLNVAAAYLQLNNSGSNNTGGAVSSSDGTAQVAAGLQRTYGVGANYTYGPSTVGFVWTPTQFDSMQSANVGGTFIGGLVGTNLRLDNYEINGRYALTPALSLAGAYTYTDGRVTGSNGSGDPKWHTVSLQTDYSLCKRTDVYLGGVYQQASGEFGNLTANDCVNDGDRVLMVATAICQRVPN